MWELVDVLKELKADFLIPLGVLATALDGLGAPLLAVEDDLAVRVLFSYVPFVRKIPLRSR